MGILLKENWKIIKKEICGIDEFYSENIYGDILRRHYKANNTDIPKKATILSDPDKSREEFIKLKTPKKEEKCVKLLDDFYDVIRLQHNNLMANRLKAKLLEIFQRYNLRYTITDNGKVVLTLQGILQSSLRLLRKSLEGNTDRITNLNELEEKVSNLHKSKFGENDCIRIASLLLEGIALDRNNHRKQSLGEAVDDTLKLFPHHFLAESIKNLYSFSSDYKNLRHPGRSDPRRSKFTKYDGVLLIGLAVAFSSYMAFLDKDKAIIFEDID